MASAHPTRDGAIDAGASAARGRSSLHPDGPAQVREAAIRGAGPLAVTTGPPEA